MEVTQVNVTQVNPSFATAPQIFWKTPWGGIALILKHHEDFFLTRPFGALCPLFTFGPSRKRMRKFRVKCQWYGVTKSEKGKYWTKEKSKFSQKILKSGDGACEVAGADQAMS